MQLAHEFRRPDWRCMLAGMSLAELRGWAGYFSNTPFGNALFDRHMATLKGLVVAVASGGEASADGFALLRREPECVAEKSAGEIMQLAAGLAGGINFE